MIVRHNISSFFSVFLKSLVFLLFQLTKMNFHVVTTGLDKSCLRGLSFIHTNSANTASIKMLKVSALYLLLSLIYLY